CPAILSSFDQRVLRYHRFLRRAVAALPYYSRGEEKGKGNTIRSGYGLFLSDTSFSKSITEILCFLMCFGFTVRRCFFGNSPRSTTCCSEVNLPERGIIRLKALASSTILSPLICNGFFCCFRIAFLSLAKGGDFKEVTVSTMCCGIGRSL